MSKDITILFGAPGTGKTTYLINTVEKALSQGVDPKRIAYLSFSRKAAREAMTRSMEKFKLTEASFPWVRTLHSVAYKLLELRRHDVMTTAHFKELGQAIGVVFNGTYDLHTERPPIELNSLGDRCLVLYARAKARRWTLEQEWRYANEWDLPFAVLKGFVSHLEGYKRDRGVIDFTDMIDEAQTFGPLDIDLMIVDEAQDLTKQQWEAARLFGANAKEVYLAGDDDQAIYSFSGATVGPLLSLRGKRIVLPQSYRLPAAIKTLADKVSAQIKTRELKTFASREDKGNVTWLREPDDVDLSHGSWLLLCRNRSQLKVLETIARRQNVVYFAEGQWSNQEDAVRAVVMYERIRRGEVITDSEARLIRSYLPHLQIPENENRFTDWSQLGWPFTDRPTWLEGLHLSSEDREYIRGLRRRGESLTKPGRVVISTVHGAKGGEADNVLLLTDISGRVAKGFIQSPDDEWRVVYVAISRAKEALYLCQPSSRNFWSIAA